MTRILLTLCLLLSTFACSSDDPSRHRSTEALARIKAASVLKAKTQAALPRWNVSVAAHGRNCSVLFLRFEGKFLEQRDVDSLHYVGRISHPALQVEGCPEVLPAYESVLLHEGGIYAFAKKHHFRGTVYVDGPPENRRVYGDVMLDETFNMEACHGE